MTIRSDACLPAANGTLRSAVHTKKYATFPKPPRKKGIVSNSTAIAATTTMAGNARKINGATKFQISMCRSSPRISCIAIPDRASTAIINVSTVRLLNTLPST